jgi:hypothetical protein
MKVAVKNGYIQVLSLQFGKKENDNTEFLNGISFSEAGKGLLRLLKWVSISSLNLFYETKKISYQQNRVK